MHPLLALSPLDGRYGETLQVLSPYFSEMALMRYRLRVEVEYFIALANEKGIREVPPFSVPVQKKLRNIYEKFSLADAQKIKKIEGTTNHDVKATEYFLKEKISTLPCKKYGEFIHFALTSEDVNNLAYTLMWRDGVQQAHLPQLLEVHQRILAFAQEYKKQPLLALTHGQSATPTTVGKEFAVFAQRLQRQMRQLQEHRLQGKLNGATGTFGAHQIAFPNINWLSFSKKFVGSLGLEPNPVTTQIEPHDSLVESFHILERINTILLDFSRDVWFYIMRGILAQKRKAGEVGSSTMPHKINPIQFENAEGNLGLANSYLHHFAQKLPVSRMQRDLSDSTVLRNQGVPLGHSFLACQNILTGMARLTINPIKLQEELDEHWEVLAEAVQTILRKLGYPQAYEKLKALTRGQHITQTTILEFVKTLDIPAAEKKKLLRLTPHTYTGLAQKIVEEGMNT